MEPIQMTTSPAPRATREVTPSKVEAAREPVARETPTTGPGERTESEGSTEGPKPADVKESVDRLNDLIQSVRRELHFSVDEDSGRTVIKVIDSKTQEIVRQIPAEEVMTLVERLAAERPSLMADVEA